MPEQSILSVKDLEVFYGGIQALHGVCLEVGKGEILSIIGANGAGKSALLKTIAGDQPIGKGSILFEGKPLPARVHQFSEIGISLVAEGRRIFVNLSVYENLLVGAYHVKGKKVIEQRLEEVYALFPRLYERRKQISGSLSGGEQQMLAVGRAMMATPKLLLLDEPSMGLAPIVVEEVFKIIRRIKEMGTTMLLVEQNAMMALKVCDRAYIINTGEIVGEDTAEHIMSNKTLMDAYLGSTED